MWNLRGGVLGVSVALGVAGVAGCSAESGGSVARPLTSLPASAAPTPEVVSPSPAPDVVDENTGEGAQRAVRRFIAATNRAYRTGDDAHLRRLSGHDCKACKRYLASIEQIYRQDGAVRSFGFKPTSVIAGGETAPDARGVVVQFDALPFSYLDGGGTEQLVEPATQDNLHRYDVRYEENKGWLVDGIARLREE